MIMTRVKIFCVTKNEYDLIEHFIIYYSFLFGYNNVHIIDNHSSDEEVLKIYSKYINLGVTVVYEGNYEGNGQAVLFTKYMSLERDNCDFMIGLDTDEFLFCNEDFKKGDNAFCKDKILQTIETYKETNTSFKISSYPCSVVDTSNTNYINNKFINPAMEIIYFSDDVPISENFNEYWSDISKYFVRSNAFVRTSNGNHSITVSHGEAVNSGLGLLHFNNTGKRRFFERAKLVIDGYKYFSTSLSLQEQIDIILATSFSCGSHKVNSYHLILLRIFILDLFIIHIKRLPTQHELKIHSFKNMKNISSNIEKEFIQCQEAVAKQEELFVFNDETEKNNIIFFDETLEELSLQYRIYKNSHLREFFISKI